MPVFTFSLGWWQVRRLEWKRNLIADLSDKAVQPPVPVPRRIASETVPEFAYRKVRVVGEFDHAQEMVVGPKVRNGENGYDLVTPLVRGDGADTILVNRGFVRKNRVPTMTRPDSRLDGPVEIVGFLRAPVAPGMFTPAHDAAAGQWPVVDAMAMAEHTHAAPLTVDAVTYGTTAELAGLLDAGVPVGRAGQIELRNMHASYAVTWSVSQP